MGKIGGMSERRPNVVLVLTDDQGWGDLGCTGNRNLHTPQIDRLAARGAAFEHFYVQPLCAPTRAELLTGRYYPRTGVSGVCLGTERLALDEVTIADLFRAAGYATGCFGKWHSGQPYPYHPNGRGFDEFVGYCCGHWSHYFDSTIERNGVEFRSQGYLTDALTDHALAFIESQRERPFFCYVPLNTPHSPFQVPDRWYDRFRDCDLPQRATHPEKEDLSVTRAALAMCENIDWNVGRIAERLAALGLERDTVVVYLSDNGPNSWRWNGGMAGKKGDAEEGGVRSPCVVTWPGQIAPGTRVDRIAGAIDLLPTLCDLCGVEAAATKPLDGVSLRALLCGEPAAGAWPDRMLFARQVGPQPRISVRTQRHRAGGALGGLYDLEFDAGQRHDLSSAEPAEHRRLMAAIEAWRQTLPAACTPSAIPVGYREFPNCYLPTQDATLTGGLRRSSIHPNCSYVMDWTDSDATISWAIDVRTAGIYEVTLMYACRTVDVGSELLAQAGSAVVTCRLDESFDRTVLDRDDRVPREESYDKPFRALGMGRLELESGEQTLALGCVRKAGERVGEVRALALRLV